MRAKRIDTMVRVKGPGESTQDLIDTIVRIKGNC